MENDIHHIENTLRDLFARGEDMEVYDGESIQLCVVGIHNINELRSHGLTEDEAYQELAQYVQRRMQGVE